ncbi:hypothetical protein SAMN04489716_1923 [Actinoplanes derwentensis]|uniref:Uncharacterized protein n=2 Tax=Actinoplanes derwentensis TaxID=113562 RepID=A0A1H1VZG1_9ACTN|nr:hypothetical protein SAMN04489716_1923 [Actinoplanes derwentensis]
MESNGADRERPGLRIGGYVPGHAEPVAGSEYEPGDRSQQVNLPNIADYWPDTANRPRNGGTPPDFADFGEPPPERSRRGRTAVVGGLLVGAIAVGTLLLMRPTGDREPQNTAAPAAPAPSVSALAPSVSASAPVSASAAAPASASAAPVESTPPAAAITTARFDLVTGVTELNVKTADLDGENFRVTTPKNSGLDVTAAFTGETLKVSAEPDGTVKGSGRVDVLLSKDIVWRLRMTAGVRRASLDMGGGTVSDIDLIGGAQTIDIELGNLDGILPILMAGGVEKWRIITSDEVPVEIAFTSGAGDVKVYGRPKGGVGEGLTVQVGDLAERPGLDIDAEAGLGSLEITRD